MLLETIDRRNFLCFFLQVRPSGNNLGPIIQLLDPVASECLVRLYHLYIKNIPHEKILVWFIESVVVQSLFMDKSPVDRYFLTLKSGNISLDIAVFI